jgi:hypothetical protein
MTDWVDTMKSLGAAYTEEQKQIHKENEEIRDSAKKLVADYREAYEKKMLKARQIIADVNRMTDELRELMKEPEDWCKGVRGVLSIIFYYQDNLDLGDIPENACKEFPPLGWLGDILLREGFIRKISTRQDGSIHPYRLTFRGLALYNLLPSLEGGNTESLLRLLELTGAAPKD